MKNRLRLVAGLIVTFATVAACGDVDDGHQKDPIGTQTQALVDKDCIWRTGDIIKCLDLCEWDLPPEWCPKREIPFDSLEDWRACGYDLPMVTRSDWGMPFPSQNLGAMVGAANRLSDTSPESVIVDAIRMRIFPPMPNWPATLFPTNYDVGNMLRQYGYTWQVNELSWPVQHQATGMIHTLVVHYTATNLRGDCSPHIRAFTNDHVYENGWGDIGYNFVVCEDGGGAQVFEGRWSGIVGAPWYAIHSIGAHSPPNSGTVGISMVLDAGQQPTASALETFMRTVAQAAIRADVRASGVVGHRDRNSTVCPGALYPHLGAIRDRVTYCRRYAGYPE